jgi:hypothetical protein
VKHKKAPPDGGAINGQNHYQARKQQGFLKRESFSVVQN